MLVNAGATKYASATVVKSVQCYKHQMASRQVRDTVGKYYRALHEDFKTLTIEDPVGCSRKADTWKTIVSNILKPHHSHNPQHSPFARYLSGKTSEQ